MDSREESLHRLVHSSVSYIAASHVSIGIRKYKPNVEYTWRCVLCFKKERIPTRPTLSDLEDIMLSEISQSKGVKLCLYCMVSLEK